jgi:hypothetical protein
MLQPTSDTATDYPLCSTLSFDSRNESTDNTAYESYTFSRASCDFPTDERTNGSAYESTEKSADESIDERADKSSHETTDESADDSSHEGSYESADESSIRMFPAPKNRRTRRFASC